jgi:hypothetical protein
MMIIISDTFRLAVHARWQMKEDERLDEEEEEDDDDGYLIFFFFFFSLTGANKMPTLTQHVNLILSTMLLLLLLFPFIFSSRGETSDARRRKRMEEKKGTLIQNHKTKRSYKNMRKEKKAVIS